MTDWSATAMAAVDRVFSGRADLPTPVQVRIFFNSAVRARAHYRSIQKHVREAIVYTFIISVEHYFGSVVTFRP